MAREILATYIDKIPNLNLIKSCSSAIDGLSIINDRTIDLIFLDINMPEVSGLTFAKSIRKDIKVIFTTAYDEYGIKAVKAKALDYLLKPIDIDELTLAMIKLKKVLKNRTFSEVPAKINIQADGKVYLIPKEDVLYLKSDKSYTTINLTNGKNIIATKTLKEVQKKFTCPEFVRVHNSYVVNLNYVIEYNKGANELTLNDGTIVAVSRSKKSEVINALNLDK